MEKTGQEFGDGHWESRDRSVKGRSKAEEGAKKRRKTTQTRLGKPRAPS